MNGDPDGWVHSEMSGAADDLVQARDVHGGIHFHRPRASVPVPRQLPWDQGVFINRDAELAALDSLVLDASTRLGVIVGMAGIGKTSLALRWSQRNRDRFPDGQLYANLHGYDQDLPVPPKRVLERFLLALGVPRGMDTSLLSLDVLVGAHLLEQCAPDRYQFHDLVRSYAMDQARQEEEPGNIRNATRRVLTWYMRSADAAQSWINPNEPHIVIEADADDPGPTTFESYDEAVHWFEQERGNLVAAVRSAEGQNMHEITWKLAVVLRGLYMEFNPFDDWITTSQAGLRAAEALGDHSASAELLESLGMARTQLHELDRSTEDLRNALELRRRLSDRPGTALTLNSLGLVLLRRHRLAEAREAFEECLGIYDELGDTRWPPIVRANLAEILIGLGQYPEAAELLDGSLETFRERGDAGGEGNALRLLSTARRGLSDLDAALRAARTATEIAASHRNAMWEGYWLLELGMAQNAAGRFDEALATFERSAFLQHRIGDKVREAQAQDGSGIVLLRLGRAAEAADYHRRAAEVFRGTGVPWLLARALRNLALARRALGDTAKAREAAAEAARIVAEFSDPSADAMRAELRDLS